jgi:hypothetical protein
VTPGSLAAAFSGDERQREIRTYVLLALCFDHLGGRHPATIALRQAIADPGTIDAALAEIERLATWPGRRIVSSFVALCWPSPPPRKALPR